MTRYFIPWGDNWASMITSIPGIPQPAGIHFGATHMSGKFVVESSCKYDFTAIAACVNDTNKLVGFGYGLYPNAHHKWSIRIGWRCVANDKLILSLYAYVNGKRVIVNLGTGRTFKFDTEYDFTITNDTVNKKAIVTIGTYIASIDFNYNPSWGYVLKPYFGGDCTAPHDMYLKVDYNIQ